MVFRIRITEERKSDCNMAILFPGRAIISSDPFLPLPDRSLHDRSPLSTHNRRDCGAAQQQALDGASRHWLLHLAITLRPLSRGPPCEYGRPENVVDETIRPRGTEGEISLSLSAVWVIPLESRRDEGHACWDPTRSPWSRDLRSPLLHNGLSEEHKRFSQVCRRRFSTTMSSPPVVTEDAPQRIDFSCSKQTL